MDPLTKTSIEQLTAAARIAQEAMAEEHRRARIEHRQREEQRRREWLARYRDRTNMAPPTHQIYDKKGEDLPDENF